MNVWITGYRDYELNVFKQTDPKAKMMQAILTNIITTQLDDGMEWLLTGGESGVEQWALQAAADLKPQYPELQLAMMTPYAEFGKNWKPERQALLAKRRQLVDYAAAVSKLPYQNPTQLRAYQNFMLEHASRVIFIYDPQYPGRSKYAYQAATKAADAGQIELLSWSMDDLQLAAQDIAEQKNWQ